MKIQLKKYYALFLAFVLFIALIPSHANAMTNEVSYTEAIKPQYDDAKGFSEGLAAVKLGDKWGYIDETGQVVIDFLYDDAHAFSEDKAIVEKHTVREDYLIRNYYIITRDNYQLIESNWVTVHVEGSALMEVANPAYYNGYVVLPGDSGSGAILFDENGEMFDDAYFSPTEGLYPRYNFYLPPVPDGEEFEIFFGDLGYIDARPFNQGLAPVLYEESNGKHSHYISLLQKDGTLWSGPKIYDYAVQGFNFEHRLFNDFSVASIMNEDDKWGAVNKEGKMVIPFRYESLSMFSDGLATFSKNGKIGFIDIHENEVFAPQFDAASLFSDGLAAVQKGDKAYIINKRGEKIKGTENLHAGAYFIETKRGLVTKDPSEFIVIEENGKLGYNKKASMNPFEDYHEWTPTLQHDAVDHSWEIKLNMKVDPGTVNLSNVYIVDKEFNKVDFIQPTVKDSGNASAIILENTGAFKKGEEYWIIIESDVQSADGTKLGNHLKAQFKIK